MNKFLKINQNMEDDFINEIKSIEKEITGYDDYGNFTEFHDEDGVVVLTVETKEKESIFTFHKDEKSFTINNDIIK